MELWFTQQRQSHKRTKENVKVAIVEFAGAKYKTSAMTDRQYLEFVEAAVINKIQMHYKSVKRMIICEQKYRFRPNYLKGKKNRRKGRDINISFEKGRWNSQRRNIWQKRSDKDNSREGHGWFVPSRKHSNIKAE